MYKLFFYFFFYFYFRVRMESKINPKSFKNFLFFKTMKITNIIIGLKKKGCIHNKILTDNGLYLN